MTDNTTDYDDCDQVFYIEETTSSAEDPRDRGRFQIVDRRSYGRYEATLIIKAYPDKGEQLHALVYETALSDEITLKHPDVIWVSPSEIKDLVLVLCGVKRGFLQEEQGYPDGRGLLEARVVCDD